MQPVQPMASSFYAFADGQGGIHIQDLNGTRQIGVSIERYKEMERVANDAVSKAEGYYKQLVDAGLVQPKLSTEEQLAVLTQQNMALSQQVSLLTQKISSIMGENDELPVNRKGSAPEKQPSPVESGSGAATCGPVRPEQKRRS